MIYLNFFLRDYRYMTQVLEILKKYGTTYLGHDKNILTVYTNMDIFYKVYNSSSMRSIDVPEELKEFVVYIRQTDEIIVDPNFEVLKEDRNSSSF